MRTMVNLVIMFGCIALISLLVLGPDRSRVYLDGTRETTKTLIDENLPPRMKIESLKANVRKADKMVISLQADASLARQQANELDNVIQNSHTRVRQLESEVQNGKALLQSNQTEYLAGGRRISRPDLEGIVARKAEDLQAAQEELEFQKNNRANLIRTAELQTQQAKDLKQRLAREKVEIIRLEKRHRIADSTANIARKTTVLGEMGDPFNNNAHVVIRRSLEKDIRMLETESLNQYGAAAGDPTVDIDLTTISPVEE